MGWSDPNGTNGDGNRNDGTRIIGTCATVMALAISAGIIGVVMLLLET